MIYKNMAAAMILALAAGAADAQEMQRMPTNCSLTDSALPPALSGWTSKGEIDSAVRASSLNAAALPLDRGTVVGLHPTREVHYVAQPEKPGGSVAYGGMATLTVTIPGRYQVSLSSDAWVDMLKNGAALASVAHAPGPKCSSIRKTVIFSLSPGPYVLQISANPAPTATVMITRVP